MAARRTVTQLDASKRLGVVVDTIRGWRRSGCPFTKRRGKIFLNVREVQAWCASKGLQPGKQGRPRIVVKAAGALAAQGGAGAEALKGDASLEGPPIATDSATTLILKEALAKAKQAHWKARLEKLRALKLEGALVSKDEAIAAHTQAVERAKAALLSIPSKVAANVAAETNARKIEERMDALIRDVLRGLAT